MGQDYTWACKDTGLFPKNSGMPLRRGFDQRVTGPGRLTVDLVGGEYSSV